MGELSIMNGHDRDAVAVLTYPNKNVYLSVYIRDGDSSTITGIQMAITICTSRLVVGMATWAGSLRIRAFSVSKEACHSETISTYDGYQYTMYELTLHPVHGGNADTDIVNEKDFPAL